MKKDRFAESFFYVTFFVWYFFEILLDANFEYILYYPAKDVNYFIGRAVFIALLIQMVIFQEYTFRELLIILFITIPFSIAALNSDNRSMMSMWMFVVAARRKNLDKAIKIATTLLLTVIPFVVIMWKNEVIMETVIYRGGIARHSLGFSHPNQLGLWIFQLVACYCYLVGVESFGFISAMILMAAAYFTYKVPNSQTATVGIILLLIIMAMTRIGSKREMRIKKLEQYMMVASAVIFFSSIALSIINVKKYPVLRKFNKILSSRFSNCHYAMKFYPINMLGQEVKLFFQDKHYVGIYHKLYLDNAYMSILLHFGIIVFVIFCVLYLRTMYLYYKTAQHVLFVLLFVYSIYGIMEARFCNLAHNIFMIALSRALYGEINAAFNAQRMRLTFTGRSSVV